MDASFSRWVDPLLLGLVALAVALVVRARTAPASERRARVALGAAWAAWGALWLGSTPILVDAVIRAIELPPGDPVAALADAPEAQTAIVVLGAGRKTDAPDVPARETLNDAGLSRLLGAARLYALHPAAVVVLSGGPPIEAQASLDMAVHAGIPRERIVVEPRSQNTRQNAAESAAILRDKGTGHVLVVTSALHMRRALSDFRRVGIEAVPGPVDYLGRRDHGVRAFFPDAVTLGHAYQALHEIVGAMKP